MQSISKTSIKQILIVIILILSAILLLQLLDNTLYIKDIKKEVINVYGKDYVVVIFDIENGGFVINASTPVNKSSYIDYTHKEIELISSLSEYKIDLDKINRIVLQVGYHNEDTKYIKSTIDIDLSKIVDKQIKGF